MESFAYLKPVDVHGVASCIGAQNVRCYGAPMVLQGLGLSNVLANVGWQANWSKTILLEEDAGTEHNKYTAIHDICEQLSQVVIRSVENETPFITVGGDHSCAIGTWSGAAKAIKDEGSLGLIWIDAHMDAHTPNTSHSGAIHGMPVASLLGQGASELTDICYKGTKIQPRDLCLIGIRSYEPEEKALLERLGVKVFYAEDVDVNSLEETFQQALTHVKGNTYAYGISLDLDAIDPVQAPGVGSPASNGIDANVLLDIFAKHELSKEFLGFELVELNSFEDKDDKTAELALKLIEALFE